jgi:hypothetical protein
MGLAKEPNVNQHGEKNTYELTNKIAYPVQIVIETPKEERLSVFKQFAEYSSTV